ncbi:MAG: hypothetical protein ACHBN1_13280 [Heteroscytonema crispum UTEX LB 1556]
METGVPDGCGRQGDKDDGRGATGVGRRVWREKQSSSPHPPLARYPHSLGAPPSPSPHLPLSPSPVNC